MHVRDKRTAVAKVCFAAALALLLSNNWCQAASDPNIPATTPACPGGATILAPNASTAAANQGDSPLPCFTQDQGGGTGPLTITFDPSCSYVPAPPAGKTYLYQAVWDFGTDPDGVAQGTLFVPAAPNSDPTQALSSISKVFCGSDLTFTITLRIDITVVDNVTMTSAVGPSAFTQGKVHMVNANFPPTAHLVQESSPATGSLPYQLIVSASTSFDSDGYIIWAAIDWGDGSSELISPLPPNLSPTLLTHTYASPGVYRVQLSVIDNGRIPVGTALTTVPPPNDPNAALASIIAFQTGLALPAPLNGPGTESKLNQDFILVQVPGSMFVKKGMFKLDFKRPGNDRFDIQLGTNQFPDSISNADITLTIGKGTPPFAPAVFKTDLRGKFRNGTLSFQFNAKKQEIRIKIGRTSLMTALGLTNAKVVNGNVDVPISIVINSNFALSTTARFVYNTKAGKTAKVADTGMGTMPLSFPNGN